MAKKETNVYVENGYADRKEYLECLADDYDIDLGTVFSLAEILGPEEDFDAMVMTLEDYSPAFA